MVKIEQTGGRLTEEEILHGKDDAYGIYQINRKGAGRDYAFLSFDSLRSKGKVPERTEYQLVYSDILGVDENRDSLFTKFNIAHPDDFTGHSLSVSDIILIKRNGKVNVSYVDMIGFVPLPDFYKEPSLRVVEQDIEEAEYIVKVDFYVAECSEFPSLGEYHEGLTLDEAIKIYEKIPEERMHGRKGIGIDLHFPEENLYPGKCSLFEGGEICREFLDIVPFYKENKEVQKAVNYLENHFNKKEKSLMKPKKPEQAPRL